MTGTTVDEAIRAAAAEGRRTIVIGPVPSLAKLYDEFAAKLHFPGHFGHNLDALYDCLLDYALALNDPVTLVWVLDPQAKGIDVDEVCGILEDVENYASSGKGKTAPFTARVLD
ncbi:barstar family protein [Arthrobacter roseus]|uniref:barstar family protein n=1 Tax=Arthrobacter roseus TaxID=136274 RepID=UPI001964C53F|nr:barstar family protein [Arthrobacter roseus]MBM7847706.1 RNAse (barnase) inhibitor barstar [Arthrobacter roseus]